MTITKFEDVVLGQAAAFGIFREAMEAFPELDPEKALAKYVQENEITGVFFVDEFGDRCIYGGHNRLVKPYKPSIPFSEKEVEVEGRHKGYHRLEKPLNLKQINRPYSHSYRCLSGHFSEFTSQCCYQSTQKRHCTELPHLELGWNLPVDHPRHFMKFPAEIRQRIFKLALSAPNGCYLQPLVILDTESYRRLTMCRFYIDLSNINIESLPHYTWVPRRDSSGSFYEMRPVIRPILDATFLRANKTFFCEGIKLLYQNNAFSFKLMSRENTHATRSLVSTGRSGKRFSNYALYQPTADFPTGEDWLGQVNEGICQIQHRRPPLMLQQWIYLDRFLRFLSTIGPDNSAHLRTLIFDGGRGHVACSCDVNCTDECKEELANKFKTYNLFIQKLCTGLTRLVIYVPGENRVTPDLDQMCCGLDSLESVEVIQYNSNYGAGLSSEKWIPDADAAPIIEQILQQKKELRQSKLISNGAPSGIPPTEKKCDFCGEANHVWAECHNLCGVCGEFGHFRSSCSLVEENRATIKNFS
ncbi:hypothetical protein HYFRA_00008437 [Hymenoscyphus fraxineus]|uniref:CCHC-type domain-containing protein n=1 Tax=Hymenoscyphus fraxineus TaxID=746836 RepID=A0A9N9KM15_9HELO|nr:hypothetical protein HYFRA_00008437 [Hymenoscyphus fraxineus]